MTVNRDSKLIRWAYFPERLTEKKGPPNQTSVCALFWRTILGTPAFGLLAVAVVAAVSPILLCVWIGEKINSNRKGRGEKPLSQAFDDWLESSVIWQGAVAVKSRFCPIVTIRESSDVEYGQIA